MKKIYIFFFAFVMLAFFSTAQASSWKGAQRVIYLEYGTGYLQVVFEDDPKTYQYTPNLVSSYSADTLKALYATLLTSYISGSSVSYLAGDNFAGSYYEIDAVALTAPRY